MYIFGKFQRDKTCFKNLTNVRSAALSSTTSSLPFDKKHEILHKAFENM